MYFLRQVVLTRIFSSLSSWTGSSLPGNNYALPEQDNPDNLWNPTTPNVYYVYDAQSSTGMRRGSKKSEKRQKQTASAQRNRPNTASRKGRKDSGMSKMRVDLGGAGGGVPPGAGGSYAMGGADEGSLHMGGAGMGGGGTYAGGAAYGAPAVAGAEANYLNMGQDGPGRHNAMDNADRPSKHDFPRARGLMNNR